MRLKATRYAFVLTAILLGQVGRLFAQSAENVLLVVNSSSPASQTIGDYYARKRAIPSANIVRLELGADVPEEIPRDVFDRRIQQPLAAWFVAHTAYDRILYIV